MYNLVFLVTRDEDGTVFVQVWSLLFTLMSLIPASRMERIMFNAAES